MTGQAPILFLPLLAMLVIAALVDVRSRRLPNELMLAIALTGLLQSFTSSATVSPGQSVLGLLAGMGLTILLFAIRALGGGDVKLLGACGAWLGPSQICLVFLGAAIVGLVIVLVQAAWSGRLTLLFRNSGLLVLNLLHIRELGAEHTAATGTACRSIDKPLPYAVPVLMATAGLLWLGKGTLI